MMYPGSQSSSMRNGAGTDKDSLQSSETTKIWLAQSTLDSPATLHPKKSSHETDKPKIKRFVDLSPITAEAANLNFEAELPARALRQYDLEPSLLKFIDVPDGKWDTYNLAERAVSHTNLAENITQEADDYLSKTEHGQGIEGPEGTAVGEYFTREVGSLFSPPHRTSASPSISLNTDDINMDDFNLHNFTEWSLYPPNFNSHTDNSDKLLLGSSALDTTTTHPDLLNKHYPPVYMASLFAEPKLNAMSTVLTSPARKFAENPTSYFDHISSLSKRVSELFTDPFHNIQTDNKQNLLPLPVLSIKEYSSESLKVELDLDNSLRNLSALLGGLKLLQDEGFTKSSFNIIVVDNERPSVLKVVPIRMQILKMLYKLLHEATSRVIVTEMDQILDDVLEVLLHIISSLGLSIPHIPVGFLQWQKWQAIYHLQSSILSILYHALLSFIRSHIDVNGQMPTGVLSEGLQIRTLGGSIVMAPRCLRCLSGFLKQPVWAFHFEPASSTSNIFNFEGFHLSVSLQEFAQLWGPVSFNRRRDMATSQSSKTMWINTRGGTILRVKSKLVPESVTVYDNEVLCHWLGWQDEIPQRHEEALEVPIIKHFLIGVSGPEQTRPRRRELEELKISDYCECPVEDNYSSQFSAFELGTKQPSWYMDAVSSQMLAGKYVSVSMGCTYKFDAGWTLKDSIIDNWLDSDAAKINRHYMPHQWYLDYLSVVEISHCTGNARRISLWTLLKTRCLTDWFRTRFETMYFYGVVHTIKQLHAIEYISEQWQTLSSGRRKRLISAFRCILSELRYTGVGDDNLLQVWDITEYRRRDSRKLNPLWTSMVKDSVGCVTFAVITPTCMTCSDSEEGMLKTMICVDTKGLEERPGKPKSNVGRYQRFSSIWGATQSRTATVEECAQQIPENENDRESLLIERLTQRQGSREDGIARSMELSKGTARAYPPDTSVATTVADQAKIGVRLIPKVSGSQQPIQRQSRNPKINVGDYFQFVDIKGKKLGRLILEPHHRPNKSF
jgi:hypothetical protein